MIAQKEFVDISLNIKSLNDKINSILDETGRTINDITVIAVTKTVDLDRVQAAVKAGCLNLGENRVQELIEKYDNLNEGVNWHMIGRLQTNKVKYIVDKVSLIHSVDRLKLGKEIDRQASKIGRVVPVLVQVNASKESTKAGIDPLDTIDFVNELSRLQNLKVMGLMTIGPNTDNKEDIRSSFRRVKSLFDELKKSNINNIETRYLSMGMSKDFDIALMEGSNMIRVGTTIFGQRQ